MNNKVKVDTNNDLSYKVGNIGIFQIETPKEKAKTIYKYENQRKRLVRRINNLNCCIKNV